jgi:hypothetical protein
MLIAQIIEKANELLSDSSVGDDIMIYQDFTTLGREATLKFSQIQEMPFYVVKTIMKDLEFDLKSKGLKVQVAENDNKIQLIVENKAILISEMDESKAVCSNKELETLINELISLVKKNESVPSIKVPTELLAVFSGIEKFEKSETKLTKIAKYLPKDVKIKIFDSEMFIFTSSNLVQISFSITGKIKNVAFA